MTERLSDEQLELVIEMNGEECYAGRMASELLELRSKIAAGPVMPETPSDDVLYASLHPEVSQARRAYRLIRNALAAEQNDPR